MNVLAEEQAGFRKGYGTTHHIFNLKCLIDLYLFRGKNYIVHSLTIKKLSTQSIEFIYGRNF